MGQARGRRCAVFLGAALALDAAGLGLVLAGAVGRPRLAGASLEEFLVLSGALLLFLSLLCWLFWYSGNLRGLPADELPAGARESPPVEARRGRSNLGRRLAAKLSQRLSQRRCRFVPAAPAASPAAPAALALSLRPLEPAAAAAAPPSEQLV